MALTDIKIKSLTPKGKDFKAADGKGLYLLVKKTGAKYWRLKYRFNGKEKVFACGIYPETSLKKARLKTDDAKRLLMDGIDPNEDKKQKSYIANSNYQFKALALEWMSTKKDWAKQTRADRAGAFKNHIFPFIGSTPINEITKLQLINIVDRLKLDGKHSKTIGEIIGGVSSVFKYAIAMGACERNLAQDIKPLLPTGDKVTHRAALDRKDIPLFLNQLDNYGGSFSTVCALKLLILTAARPGEVFGAVWSDFDLDNAVWLRPSERMKARKEHPTPLCKQALKMLTNLHRVTGNRQHLFPNERRPTAHMSENTLNQAINRRMGFNATAHGMRSVFSSLANEFGFNPDAIEMQLAHVEKNEVRRAYNRSQYWEERVVMAQQWADYLDGLKAGTNVIPFKRKVGLYPL